MATANSNTTAHLDTSDPTSVSNELAKVRDEIEALLNRLDKIDDAGADLARTARAAQVSQHIARTHAEAVAEAAGVTAGHLRRAVSLGLREGERAVKRLTDQITEASAGGRR